jgi:hypothetical protein
MILGTEARVRPLVDVDERPSGDHRDRGHSLTPRLHPTTPSDAWQPASSYTEVDSESM